MILSFDSSRNYGTHEQVHAHIATTIDNTDFAQVDAIKIHKIYCALYEPNADAATLRVLIRHTVTALDRLLVVPPLTKLKFVWLEISVADARSLATDVLPRLKRLQKLSFRCSRLGDEGIAVIAP